MKSWNSVNYCSNNDVDEASQNESEIPSKLQRNSYAVMGRCSKRKKLSNFFTVISVFVPFITSSRMESPHFYSQSDSTHCNLIFIVDNKSLFIWIVFRELFFFFFAQSKWPDNITTSKALRFCDYYYTSIEYSTTIAFGFYGQYTKQMIVIGDQNLSHVSRSPYVKLIRIILKMRTTRTSDVPICQGNTSNNSRPKCGIMPNKSNVVIVQTNEEN